MTHKSKTCIKCKIRKILSKFYTYKNGRSLNQCKACNYLKTQEWANKNKLYINQKQKARRKKMAENPKYVKNMKKYKREYYLKNKEKIIKRSASYYHNPENIEKIKTKAARYRMTHKEEQAKFNKKRNVLYKRSIKYREKRNAWAKNNPEKATLIYARARIKRKHKLIQASSGEVFPEEHKKFLMELDLFDGKNFIDYVTQKRLTKKTLSFDHVIPISRGGLNIIQNILPMNRRLNSSKNNKLLDEWDFPNKNFTEKVSAYLKLLSAESSSIKPLRLRMPSRPLSSPQSHPARRPDFLLN